MPHVMVAMNVFAADTEEDARTLASSQQQSFVALRTGKPGKLPVPIKDYTDSLPAPARAMIDHLGQAAAVGTPQQVRTDIEAFVERTRADEILLCGSTYDPDARLRSMELAIRGMRKRHRLTDLSIFTGQSRLHLSTQCMYCARHDKDNSAQ